MKKILLSTLLVLGMMTLTTGCTGNHSADSGSKCAASGKCDKAKKCESGKCGGSKADAKKCNSGKCGSK
jgi:hypothetical protein